MDMAGKANLALFGPLQAMPASPARERGPLAYARNLWSRLFYDHAYRDAPQLASTREAISFLANQLEHNWTLTDAGLSLEKTPDALGIELRSSRVFLELPTVAAANRIQDTPPIPILTYLANLLTAGTNATPYSMVTAAGPPYSPAGMRDDEIVVHQARAP